MIAATVSGRAQSRWNSQASETQPIGWPPACVTRSRAVAGRLDCGVPRRAMDSRGTDRGRRQSPEPIHLARHPQRSVSRHSPYREDHHRNRVDRRPVYRRQDSREPDHHGHPRDDAATWRHARTRRAAALIKLGLMSLATDEASNAAAIDLLYAIERRSAVTPARTWSARYCGTCPTHGGGGGIGAGQGASIGTGPGACPAAPVTGQQRV